MSILPSIVLPIVLILLISISSNISITDAENENSFRFEGKIPTFGELKQKYSDFSPKINSKILDVITDENPSAIAKRLQMNFKDGKVTVYVYLDSSETKKEIPKNIEIISSSENIVVANVNLQQINQLSQFVFVQRIDVPVSGTLVNHMKSEGVEFSFTDEMYLLNYTGNGIKIAIIDGGFLTSNSEITSNIVFSKHCTAFGTVACGDTNGNSHGTAVGEIVVDMAPDAQLYLYSTANSFGGIDLVDVQNAIDDAISKNVDIITMSLGFRGIGGDGNSGYEKDGTSSLSKKVNNAKNAGILVTVAAGNTAKSHWSGTYSVSSVIPSSIGAGELTGYQSVMNFRPSASGLQKACLPVTDFGGIYLAQWNDWTTTNQDYDLILYDSSMSTAAIAGSAEVQSGSQPPLEVIGTGPPIGNGCIVLASWSSTQNHFFHIEMDNLVDPNVGNPDRSITIPADATGALGVGALDQTIDQFEDFSSQGPTDDSRLKPEICGPDNTLSHQSQLNPFVGTSAAAPHVAGAAALLLQNNTSLSSDQLKNELINNARFNSNYSISNLCGSNSGALSLPKDIDNDGIKNSQDNCLNDANPDQADLDNDNIGDSCDILHIITNDTILTTNLVLNGNVIVQNNSLFTIQPGIKLGIDFSSQKILVKQGSGILIKSGGTITVPSLVLDDDFDGIANGVDNCPFIPNSNQTNSDSDLFGDACDIFPNELLMFELVNSIPNPNTSNFTLANSPRFGGSMDVSDNYFLVGARFDGIDRSGLVYVFNATTFQLLHTLSSPNQFPVFGGTVAFSENKIFVNDESDDEGSNNAGAIFVYDPLTGNQTNKILNPDPGNEDKFPFSLASYDDYLLAGAYLDKTNQIGQTGRAFLFNSTSEELIMTFENPTPELHDRFGYSVAIFENKILVGDSSDNSNGTNTGVAFLFDSNSGNLTQTFYSPNPGLDGQFGHDVSIYEDKVLISARHEMISGLTAGKAYLFNATTGEILHTLQSPFFGHGNEFGFSVSINAKWALIGEPNNNLLVENGGLAHLFDVNTGEHIAGFKSPTPDTEDRFGFEVFLDPLHVRIGSEYDDLGSSEGGAVFIFKEKVNP